MKKVKWFSMVLAGILVTATAFSMVGCGEKNSENVINVSVINKGYSTNWIDTLMTEFLSSDAKYSGYSYKIYNSYDDDTTKGTVESGINTCNYDLVIHSGNPTLIDDKYLLDISDVYNMSFENKTLKDYMDESVVSSFKNGNGYVAIPWVQAVGGIVVNYDIVKSALGENWENTYKNRTSEEFMAFIAALRNNLATGKTPFVITSKKGKEFYQMLYEPWWAQYEGMEGIKNYYTATYQNGDETVSDDIHAFLQKGKLFSLKETERIFSVAENYELYSAEDSMQTAFMEGKSAMICNGDWMQIEQSKYTDVDMRFIKTPVISALGAKLGLSVYTEQNGGGGVDDIRYDISDETKFIAAIDYVDALLSGSTDAVKPAYLTDEQVETIKEARKMVYSNIDYSCVSIPNYSIKKDVALDFLKWMYSKEGQKNYVSAMSGLTLPVKNSFATDSSVNMSKFAKSAAKISNDAVYVFPNRNWKYAKAGLSAFEARREGVIEYLLTGRSDSEINTAYAVYRYDYRFYDTGTNWEDLKDRAK